MKKVNRKIKKKLKNCKTCKNKLWFFKPKDKTIICHIKPGIHKETDTCVGYK